MGKQFDLNKFNSLLDTATKVLSCGPDCQYNKAAENLKQKYESAESNLVLAEPNYELAKKNYYIYVSGENGYNEMIEKELTQKSTLFVKKFKENYNIEKNKIKTQLNTYGGLLINYNNVVELYEKYKNENEKLERQLKDNTNEVLTNERKTYYEEQQNDILNLYYYYFLIVIYYIIVICFVIFYFLYPSTIDWKIILFLVLGFIILPLISTFVLGKIINFSYQLFDLLPKNVYK